MLSIVGGGTVILIGLGISFLLAPKEPEYLTELVKRGDLRETVEAVGTVISEKDLALQFPTSGVVAQVLVKEGDRVVSGQKLVTLRAGNLAAEVSSASARLQSAEADLRALLEGARPEDIAITEAEVANKRAALEAARATLSASESKLQKVETEAATSLAGYITTSKSTATKELAVAESALAKVDDVLSNPDIQDGIARRGVPLLYSSASLKEAIRTAQKETAFIPDHHEAIKVLQTSRAAIALATDGVNIVFNIVADLTTSNTLTASERETHKTTLSTQKSNLQTSLSNLDTALKNLQDAAANFDTKIAAEESTITSARGDILTYETSLRIEEAQLNLKKAPARQTDIDVAQARVREVRADLSRVQASYADSILTAPIDGVITKVNVKPGESLSMSFQSDAPITMLGSVPYRIEMYASEIDVPKINVTQSGSIILDAFPGIPFALRVSEIDSAATEKDGVPKYRLKLDFVHPHEELKIGMTGDTEILTGERVNVLSIPRRAILERDDGTEYVRILQENGTLVEEDVTTGMEGGSGDIEVLSGVSEGDMVVVLIKE